MLLRFIRKINRPAVENELLAEGIDENEDVYKRQPILIVAHRYSPIITDKYQGSPKWKKI